MLSLRPLPDPRPEQDPRVDDDDPVSLRGTSHFFRAIPDDARKLRLAWSGATSVVAVPEP